jgi:SAM-dependent methyltransferase
MIPNPSLNIWEHSRGLLKLCQRRALDLEPEMDGAAQGVEILTSLAKRPPGQRLLDVGCGGGHFYHSLKRGGLLFDYFGLDYSPSFVKVAREALVRFGQDPSSIMLENISDLTSFYCQAAVVINTLTFCPDFRAPLDRIIDTGAEIILIRDNFGQETKILWETDGYLDEGFNHLKGYWNKWSMEELDQFFKVNSFKTSWIEDKRTAGLEELVVDKSYNWSWLLAKKE